MLGGTRGALGALAHFGCPVAEARLSVLGRAPDVDRALGGLGDGGDEAPPPAAQGGQALAPPGVEAEPLEVGP